MSVEFLDEVVAITKKAIANSHIQISPGRLLIFPMSRCIYTVAVSRWIGRVTLVEAA
jgi:hypothetical protein